MKQWWTGAAWAPERSGLTQPHMRGSWVRLNSPGGMDANPRRSPRIETEKTAAECGESLTDRAVLAANSKIKHKKQLVLQMTINMRKKK